MASAVYQHHLPYCMHFFLPHVTLLFALRLIAWFRLVGCLPLLPEQVRLAHFAIERLRNANKRCLVCDEIIEGFVPAVPIVCPQVRSW